MMKNKYLILGLVLTSLIGGMSSCKKDVDVTKTCKEIALKTIVGTTDGIRSGSQLNDDLLFNVVQYQFLPGSKATRTVVNWGNRVSLSKSVQNFSYTLGDFGDNGVGITLFFTPENVSEAPYSVVFMNNELTEKGTGLQYSLPGTDNKVASITAIDTTFNNIRCEFSKSEYWTEKVKYMDTTYYKHIVVIGGKPKVVTDTLVAEKERTDTICQKIKQSEHFEFYRDNVSLENTGYWSHAYKEQNKDKSLVLDTAFAYNFKWSVASVTSKKKFTIRIVSTDPALKDEWTAAVSQFDPVKETITIDGNEYTFIKPE